MRHGASTWVAASILLVSIAGLAMLFLRTVDLATEHFDRAALSQAQLRDVLAIRSAARAGDSVTMRAAIARYRMAIEAEGRILGNDGQRSQSIEQDHAANMSRLAATGTLRSPDMIGEIERAASRERVEARETAGAVEDLRLRTRIYAALLTATALLAALVGAAGLSQANRLLSRAVADRTARLVAIDRSRRLFFAKVSHELRTPVTVMRGEAEVALATAAGDPEVLATALADVVAHSEQLDHRIADLLALSQAEDGRLVLADERCDLASVARQAIARGGRYAASNNVSIVAGALSSSPVRGDPRWIEQALVALIDNAVKFSHRDGQVEVTVTSDGRAAAMTVADRGIGALPDAMPKLFDAYYQTADGQARGGSGLGLALVRWVAEQHGGRASAAVREGGGCVVTIALPLAA